MSPGPICSAFWSTSTLFLGHVVEIEHVYDKPPAANAIGPGQYIVHFDVTEAYRGGSGRQAVVHTADQGSACGFEFKQGHDYLVYASAAPNGDLSTNHCTGTHEVVKRADDADIQWIEALPKAPPGASVFGRILSLRPNPSGSYDAAALADITVAVTGPETKTVTSGADGKFRADGLAPGKYVVSAAAPERYEPFPNWTVTLQDRGCAEVGWSTRLDGHIRGHLYFSDGTPAAGIYLTSKAADARPGQPWADRSSYVTTAADGGFDFSPLAAGSYVFAANMDFSMLNGTYYRKAYFPGTAHRSEAAAITVGAGEIAGDLRFFLPPDSPPPSIAVEVTVAGFDGAPVPNARIAAYDDMWENSVTPVTVNTDTKGKATVVLRPGSHYDVVAWASSPGPGQSCAEPLGVDAREGVEPLRLVLSHRFGNCLQFKKRSAQPH
jgi:protocatechuate 3,4-dioxygenase beta subunit